ncbi:hypothetical protein Esi_0448_0002 [Ectocarpus siliculosus]|uniref:Uncharacterized protein n=1 Tax=Ectocarpus siliculosus TaxID=2880 RepID=D7G1D3_ECTSI|nr:hypothetical protein Esi_0448_0002 [Ectocarpus siliculosus]|eukprot:CBJ33243.1 hypothetical protein Esi_0448_0002 [Ectocarpus siliculosus]
MPPAVDLELELRRLGCVDGVLGLLRRRSINESDHVYADRIQLGAALLACKLDLRAAPTKCGATAIAAGRGGAGGDEEGSALAASWGEEALASVLTLVVQGCRHVSRALALGLHESEDCAKAFAHDEHRVTTLLAIVFPGGQVKILGDHGNVAASSGTVDAAATATSASLGSLGAETSIGDYETRENALSCIYSIVQADATAVESIQSARGLWPLFVLAMGEEPASGDGDGLSAREGQGNHRRPRTSMPGPRLFPSRRNSTTSTVVSFAASDGGSGGRDGIGVKRPMTTGAWTPARSPLVPDKAASGSATAADLKSWGERGLPRRGGQATGRDGGGGVSRRGAPASENPDAANPPPPGTATEESTATPSPPPPLSEGGLRTAGGGHEAQPALSASSPRAIAVDAVFSGGGEGGRGGGVTRRDKPLTLLAASILLAGLRGGAHRLATVKLGRGGRGGGGGGGGGGGASKQPTGSREGASSGSKRNSRRSTTGRKQELGVVILERGIEELEGWAYVGRGEEGAADETGKQDARRRHSSSAASTTIKHKRERQQQLVRAGSGTLLRSLCWLLLHQRRGVSDGAAAILLALAATLTSTPNNTHLKHAVHDGPAAWVVIDLIEQGCVPILRMAGGGVAPSTLEAEVEGGGGSIVSRQAARVILEAVVAEACGRHAGRLVRSVMSSGSRKLRANVALGLTVLSAGTGGVLGREAWELFVTGGALPAVLGMLRSPTGRPAAVSFLRTVSALLGGDPAPQNIFSEGVVYYEGKGGGYSREGWADGGGLAGPSESADEEEEDTVVLVVDPLTCLEREKGISSDRGEHTEEEGIKMACPPRKVICRASTRLRDVIINSPAGELPLLRGRYRTWEEASIHRWRCIPFRVLYLLDSNSAVLPMCRKLACTGYHPCDRGGAHQAAVSPLTGAVNTSEP